MNDPVKKRAWYRANREKVLARVKAWRAAHIEECRAYDRAYSQKRRARENELERTGEK